MAIVSPVERLISPNNHMSIYMKYVELYKIIWAGGLKKKAFPPQFLIHRYHLCIEITTPTDYIVLNSLPSAWDVLRSEVYKKERTFVALDYSFGENYILDVCVVLIL